MAIPAKADQNETSDELLHCVDEFNTIALYTDHADITKAVLVLAAEVRKLQIALWRITDGKA